MLDRHLADRPDNEIAALEVAATSLHRAVIARRITVPSGATSGRGLVRWSSGVVGEVGLEAGAGEVFEVAAFAGGGDDVGGTTMMEIAVTVVRWALQLAPKHALRGAGHDRSAPSKMNVCSCTCDRCGTTRPGRIGIFPHQNR
jgi:hypothetical protein